MPSARLVRILAHLKSGTGDQPGPERLCEVTADVVGASGAGIMVMSAASQGSTICTSNEVSALIEELQFTLGEGPCLDAFHHTLPVLEPDLADPRDVRWPAFAPPAVAAGARAIFGFPLRLGAVTVGALNLYRSEPGVLDDDQQADAMVLADVAARSVLSIQSHAAGGTLGRAIEEGSQMRIVVHQASGMVAVQLGVTLNEALVRLRGYAFATDRLVTDVARDVVARRLRFDEDPAG
jgi:GAF domain-containing protein